MTISATYSPEDDKLRLYASARLDKETYARVKGAGFRWAPKQDLFFAMWSLAAEDIAIELAGDIDDEDTSLVDRAEERSERFEGYQESRAADAERAHKAVAAIADNIPLGQPILVGHHSERHARRDAKRIENGMRKAVKMWKTSEYWRDRAAGALRHAKYKERPDVRARRIKGLEADLRKVQKTHASAIRFLGLWRALHEPDSLKRKDGQPTTFLDRALHVANVDQGIGYGTWSELRDGKTTPEEAQAKCIGLHEATIARCERWGAHYENRLLYERAMLADAGGTVAEKTGPERGGACRCWASPGRFDGGWSYIVKVNKVSVTVLDNWGNGGENFTRTIELDKLTAVMTRAEVEEKRAAGLLAETEDKRGFFLRDAPAPAPRPAPAPPKLDAAPFKALEASLKAGVKVVAAPQLFPTPRALARRLAEAADIEDGARVLEPSAGTGVLVEEIRSVSGFTAAVTAVEINRALADALGRINGGGSCAAIHCRDFTEMEPSDLGDFDRIVMNPPFERGADVRHIKHALRFLRPGGRLVAVCAAGRREVLEPLALESGGTWEDLPDSTFSEQGTDVRVALVVIEGQPATSAARVECPDDEAANDVDQPAREGGSQLDLLDRLCALTGNM